MPKQQIDIMIEKDGSWSIDVTGASGTECKTLTVELEAALGKTTDTKLKPEYRLSRARPVPKAR